MSNKIPKYVNDHYDSLSEMQIYKYYLQKLGYGFG